MKTDCSACAPLAKPRSAEVGKSRARPVVRHLYVHIPFCARICPYCAFYKERADPAQTQRFCEALLRELETLRADFEIEPETIFFGGGTPTALSTAQLDYLLGCFRERLDCSQLVEWTMEANPGSVSPRKAALLRELGVTRVSLGVQSWDDELLGVLGREHDAAQAEASFQILREAGLTNVNIDLMFGLPGQSLGQWEATLGRTVALAPEHVSAYALTLDRESLAEEVPLARQLARGEVTLPSEDRQVEMSDGLQDVLGRAGLARYEISNHARPGFHSRHNTLYWTGGEYLALGVGATGLLYEKPRVVPDSAPERALRFTNLRSTEKYLAAVEAGRLPEGSSETLGRQELFEERMAMGLRLVEGLEVASVCNAFGMDPSTRLRELARFISDGFVVERGGRFALTRKGAHLHSSLSARLI